jgi:hypothetical protein
MHHTDSIAGNRPFAGLKHASWPLMLDKVHKQFVATGLLPM